MTEAVPRLHAVRLYDALSKELLFNGNVLLIESKRPLQRGSLVPLSAGYRFVVARRQQKREEVECRLYVYPHPYEARGVLAEEGGVMLCRLGSLMGIQVDPSAARVGWTCLDAITRDRVAGFARMYFDSGVSSKG